MATSTARLAEAVLGEDLEEFILSRKRQGLSWLQITKELWAATNHVVDVTPQTVQNWARNGDEAA